MDNFKTERNRLLTKLEGFQNIINGAHIETSKSIIELAINAKSLWKQRSPIERRQLLDMILSNQKQNWRSQIDEFRTALGELVTDATLGYRCASEPVSVY